MLYSLPMRYYLSDSELKMMSAELIVDSGTNRELCTRAEHIGLL